MTAENESIKVVMQMVQQLCTKYGWQDNLVADGGESNIMVRLANGAMQKVFIFGRRDINGQPVLVFYTAVMPDNSMSDYKALLAMNSQLSYAHFAIVKNKIVVLDTQLIMTADYSEVARKIQNVAEQGCTLAKRFGGRMGM
jgi:hypothetical protein